ncbi:MAG: ABC transporter ATP-binding protein [Opitutales bacterium]|nr:ABC transporter ATP-binding protein [Opitutales bacterium]MCH8539602.1 ABC transporter ATP-binding protein/permease [Opitutales bacterium]
MEPLKKLLPYFRYLKPVWGRFTLGILFGILFSLSSGLGLPVMAETIFPILFGNIDQSPPWLANLVEQWFGDNIEGGFLILCCLLIPFTMGLRAVGAFGNGYYMTYAGVHVIQSLQRDLFAKMQVLPLAFFHRNKTGELMAALTVYPQQIKTIVVDTSNDLIKQPLTLVAAVGYLTYKSLTSESFFVAIIGVLSIPLIVFPIRQIGKYLAKRSRQLVKETESLQSSAIETIQSPMEIRAYNLEVQQKEQFQNKLRRIFFLTLKSVRSKLMISPSIEFVASAGLALSLFLGVQAGISQGEFMALGVALYMAYNPLKRLGSIYGSLRALEAPLTRIEDVLKATQSIPESASTEPLPQPIKGEIEFRHVSFTYDEDIPVLKDVSAHIRAGETVALVGPSGAGKSTFINLIPRFYDPTEGQILLDGTDLRNLRLRDLRAIIAYVPQSPVLFNTSVKENIKAGDPQATDEAIYRAARHARADQFINELPQKYDTVLTERGNSLSGGQRQRIAIARAFLKNAPILILDEATSALDNKIDAEIQEALEELSKGRTTLVIAHRINSLHHIERRLYFEEGRILGDGDHETLLNGPSGYRKLIR